MRRSLLLLGFVLAALAGLYAAAGYWLLPRYLEKRLVAEASRLGYELRLRAIHADPFRLTVELEGAELVVAKDARVLAGRVRADLKLASLLSKDVLPERVTVSRGAVELADTRIQPLDATLSRQAGGYRIASAGAVSLQGSLVLQPFGLEADVAASGLPLAAAQPWIAPLARVELAAGTAAARGRLRFASAGKPRLTYTGALSLRDVMVLGPEAGAPPLASWQALEGTDVKLSVAPTRLEAGEVLLQRPAARLAIGANRRTNLAGIAKAGEKAKGSSAPFPVAVRRLTVRDGRLDFADSSLEPRFATTIRELSGTVSGLGSDGDDEARVELDGRVDRYGSARIRGVINPFAPRTRTAVTMSFRNLEMKNLTPYAAKFAGYRIESGKLSADLRYRVRDSQLVGDNRVMIDSLVLGERVAGTQASELPIELAVALLTDSKGRI
jgi:hypothetical protein